MYKVTSSPTKVLAKQKTKLGQMHRRKVVAVKIKLCGAPTYSTDDGSVGARTFVNPINVGDKSAIKPINFCNLFCDSRDFLNPRDYILSTPR